jgi:putative nucleotidyltransferase with HDIG domain
MDHLKTREEFVRRLAAALRGADLYATTHPFLQRSLDALGLACARSLQNSQALVVGFIGDEVVVDGLRLPKTSTLLAGFVRDMREREIEKFTFSQGLTKEEVRGLIDALRDRHSPIPLADRLAARNVRRITVGRITLEEDEADHAGIAMARRVYGTAVQTAEMLWNQTKAGDKPDPNATRKIIESLAKVVTQDRTSLMALTALKRYDNYTFTHMVNVSVLAMSQARSLNVDGALLREIGFAALMHDIGKVNTPLDVLNKPDKLAKDEFEVMKRHVVDGAHILRKTPETPALAPIVAFQHHLRQDLSGYPERIGDRSLDMCTMIVSIADVFDALRTNRPYRQGLATDRIRAIMGEQGNPAFNQRLLKRFVNLMGLFPVGNLVRLNTGEIAVVTAEHPGDPFRPQVKIIIDAKGQPLEEAVLANTWERNERGKHTHAVIEPVDPEQFGIDPLTLL